MIAAVTTRRRDVPKALLLQAAFVVFLLAGGLFVPLTDLGDDSLVYPLCCLDLWLTAFGRCWSWARVTRNWFDCYSLFLIAATLFNAGQALLRGVRIRESWRAARSPVLLDDPRADAVPGLAGIGRHALVEAHSSRPCDRRNAWRTAVGLAVGRR